jgi:DNA-binding MarR family transcriptional regulator
MDTPLQEVAPNSLDQMAEEIFALTVVSWRQRLATRHSGDAVELSESQFLTLDALVRASATLTVGEIQRNIGVLPAQMSRIIRSLESAFAKPLIKCDLNRTDKRKIDVTLTTSGRKAYEEFRDSRLAKTVDILRHLEDHDRLEFVRICRLIRKQHESATTVK